ncbi:hypothetical protein SAMN04488033_105124 [Salegentibacter agarivorans]|uniref:Uncharacterized protein n=1 Tax=Salegentibacter agarivorans TaxID=345907 RepID=A0A1I2KU63_9FLAO|nr:hypothetical protein [Salegentibacter agarivorans]SFF70554.1 hypothetical protein SAMN04488033_105124 [Salegentibacter agarivorans]
MTNKLYNSSFTKNSFLGIAAKLSKPEQENILAELFEQLLLFDKIIISTDKDNETLAFLIYKLGLDTVVRLVRSGYVQFSIKSAMIFTSTGRRREDGTIDESVIYNQPPISGGSLHGDEIDPSTNVYRGLKMLGIDKKERNRLINIIVPKYVNDNNFELGGNVAKVILDAYTNNNLEQLGLPFHKDPFDLNIEERKILFQLGNTILDSSMLAKNNYKSYNNYEHIEIQKKNLENIGKAYNVSKNVSEILKIENTPDLKNLYLENSFDMSDIFKIRHLSSAKYFRNWINSVGENANSYEVTEAYLSEINGHKKFFNTISGKFIKNTFTFGATTGLGSLLGGPVGAVVGAAATPIANIGIDYSLGLLEEYVLEGLIEGKNPKSYIDKLKIEINKTK